MVVNVDFVECDDVSTVVWGPETRGQSRDREAICHISIQAQALEQLSYPMPYELKFFYWLF